jgi:hypothetical protein
MPRGNDTSETSDFDWSWTDEGVDWVPPAIDPSKPSVARMYDYLLGGKDNFAVDRQAAEEVEKAAPDARLVALANREFLIDAVQTMAGAGIRQFIDLGTGIPTSPNVHEVARRFDPDARVVYVDHDPIVLVHSRALLAKHEGVLAVHHDLRQPTTILDDPQVRDLIDLSQPVGLLFVAVLHFVRQDIAPEILAQYRKMLVHGSYTAISAACREDLDPALVRRLETIYADTNAPIVFRTRAQVEQLFDGFEPVEPGLVRLATWREDGLGAPGALCGLGRRT